jgi:hypothetical protein
VYGREEVFPSEFHALVEIADSRDTELYRCPDCGSWFTCTDHEGFGGSGHSDHYAVSRVGSTVSSMLDRLLVDEEDWPTKAEAKEILGWWFLQMVIDSSLFSRRELIRAWLDELIDEVVVENRNETATDLYNFCYSSPERAREIYDKLKSREPHEPSSAASTLMENCLKVLTNPDR